jgi:antitoxin component of MazEF toxin-antitoxin module
MVLMDVARAAGLLDGEKVEIETQDGDIVMRRRSAHAQARQDAAAAEEIVAESHAQSLRGISISELRDEGRRG